jgi:hypothetical protein
MEKEAVWSNLKNDPDIWLEDLRQSHEAYNEADPWVKT